MARKKLQQLNFTMSNESKIDVLRAMEAERGLASWGITVDTNLIGGPREGDDAGFKFNRLIGDLRGLHRANIVVLTTSVWQSEVLLHLSLVMEQRRKAMNDAASGIKRFGLKPFTEFAGNVKSELARLPPANAVWEDFCANVGMKAIPVNDSDAATCLRLYQAKSAPFESRKKEEFPDALSLIALERHAAEQNLHIIVVTNDNGCLAFCKNTERLYGFATIESAKDALAQLDDVMDRISRTPEAQRLVAIEGFRDSMKQAFRNYFKWAGNFDHVSGHGGVGGITHGGAFHCEIKHIDIDSGTVFVTAITERGLRVRARVLGSARAERQPTNFCGDGVKRTTLLWANLEVDQLVEFDIWLEPGHPPQTGVVDLKTAFEYQPSKPEWTPESES